MTLLGPTVALCTLSHPECCEMLWGDCGCHSWHSVPPTPRSVTPRGLPHFPPAPSLRAAHDSAQEGKPCTLPESVMGVCPPEEGPCRKSRVRKAQLGLWLGFVKPLERTRSTKCSNVTPAPPCALRSCSGRAVCAAGWQLGTETEPREIKTDLNL